MELKTFTFRALAGPVISSPTVTVYLPGTSTLATGLKDASGAALANPFSGSVDGVITFSAPNGIYDLNIVGGGRDYTERVIFQSGAQVVGEAGSSLVATPDSAGRYTVFTSASPKTYSFDSAQSYSIGDEFHVRNSGAGDLTLVAVGSFSFNPPTYGSLVVPQGGTVTIKIVESNRADVLGVTEGDGFQNWMSNPMTSAGDIIVGGPFGSPQRFPVGSDGQVLKVVGGAPAWAAEGGGGASGGLSFSQGQTAPGLVLTNGDKTATYQAYLGGFRIARSQSFKSSGSWYFEVRCVAITSATSSVVGLSGPNYPLVSNSSAEALPGYSFCRANGQIFYNNVSSSPTGLAFATGDVIGIMLNADSGWMKIVKNGVPSSGGPIIGAGAWAPCVGFDADASSGSFEILTTPVYAVPPGFTYWT